MLALIGVTAIVASALCLVGVFFFAVRVCLKMRTRAGRPGRFDKADMVRLNVLFVAAMALAIVAIIARTYFNR